MRIALQFNSFAAIPVVPEPPNGSKIVSPSREPNKGNNRLDSPRSQSVESIFIPFRLVSLLEMLRFYAENFYHLIQYLSKFTELPQTIALANEDNKLKNLLSELLVICDEMRLVSSAKQITRIQGIIASNELNLDTSINNYFQELETRIYDDLEREIFIIVSQREATFYENTQLFGEMVFENFPSASFDIEEAGKCFAMARYTACVFHLSRAVEVSLRSLATELGITLTVPSWDGILKKIDTELSKGFKDKIPEWKKNENFYADAALYLRSYKNSRNGTQHADSKFTEQEAERILNAVLGLMQHLATNLQENKEEV